MNVLDKKDSSKTQLAAKFATGNWVHMFGVSGTESRCRIFVNITEPKLIAAQIWSGLKFEDIKGNMINDLHDSLFNANNVHQNPTEWGLSLIDEKPSWVATYQENSNNAKTTLVKVAIACKNSSGSPKFPVFEVYATKEDLALGNHLDMAEVMAEENGFKGPFICFDSFDFPDIQRAYEQCIAI